jgi:hypothetical protein
MPVAEPLRRHIEVTQLTDTEVRKVMRDAAREADRIVRSLDGVSGPGARLRSAQISLAKVQVQAWAGVKDAVSVGIGDTFDSTAEYQALFDERLMKAAGIKPQYWNQSMLAQSRAGIDSFTARRENKYTLSERVYRNQTLAQGHVDRTINNGLLLGKSAAEIAADVKKYIDPATPGGASYAASRLARSEVQNAFHANSVKQFKESPWVESVMWNLSGSHPKPDLCNEYAEDVTFRGGKPGEYHPDDVPGKPHPQCLCYIEPVAMDLDKYAKNFKAGKYDSYIDKQMGCSRVA